MGLSPPIFVGYGSWVCFPVLSRQPQLYHGFGLVGGLYGVVLRKFFLLVVGFHMICALRFGRYQVVGQQRSDLALHTYSQLLAAMVMTMTMTMAMLACMGGVCGRFVSIVVFMFSDVGRR